ncbi:prolipoprotein diacylglyceryl transferase [Asticcacaulis solisilvae]|uniref:prolipoprotein diacylglyceryl transferase n=1 Tax=Asticcacaulis solisilvae TaxID=1217274 RepID=UPI003FD706D4
MHLPVVFHLFGLPLPAHLVFESLAYGVGFRLYLWLRKQGDRLDDRTRMTALIGAIVGAGLGSKLLGFAEHPELWGLIARNPMYLLAAKTILGGLLGGIIGVEIAKATAGVKTSTGDLYVFPLLAAIAIGRIGCLLTGISDGTWGDATHFALGFDAGDGIIRHPTPLYEIAFLVALAGALWQIRRRFTLQNGDLFKLFIMAYCAWRFGIEFLKPVTTYTLTNSLNIVQNIATDSDLSAKPGLSMLQMAAVLGFAVYAWHFAQYLRGKRDGGA